ncbi:hypothetical protein PUN28_017876 [Cardiocondyla obscurior]|uniref:Uncharacterized protein n=1 Tax=Cardiocondyla obscurior TaxID=286306 RepID=A0AAW2EJD4_9HYME
MFLFSEHNSMLKNTNIPQSPSEFQSEHIVELSSSTTLYTLFFRSRSSLCIECIRANYSATIIIFFSFFPSFFFLLLHHCYCNFSDCLHLFHYHPLLYQDPPGFCSQEMVHFPFFHRRPHVRCRLLDRIPHLIFFHFLPYLKSGFIFLVLFMKFTFFFLLLKFFLFLSLSSSRSSRLFRFLSCFFHIKFF